MQALAVLRELELSEAILTSTAAPSRWAIRWAARVRILTTLIHEMHRRPRARPCATA
ncbi:MAG: hypothetical protein R2851_28785 [Caldilineaceae bacterium]